MRLKHLVPIVTIITTTVGCGGSGSDQAQLESNTTITPVTDPQNPTDNNKLSDRDICDFTIESCDIPNLEDYRDRDLTSPLASGIKTGRPHNTPVFGDNKLTEFADIYFVDLVSTLDPANYSLDLRQLRREEYILMQRLGYNIIRADGRFIMFNENLMFNGKFAEQYEMSDSDLTELLAYQANPGSTRDFASYRRADKAFYYPRTRYYWNLTSSRIIKSNPTKTKIPRGVRSYDYYISFDDPVEHPYILITNPVISESYKIAASFPSIADYSEILNRDTWKKQENDTTTYAVSRLEGSWISDIASITISNDGIISGEANGCTVNGDISQIENSSFYNNAYRVQMDLSLCEDNGIYNGSLSVLTRKAPDDAEAHESKFIDVEKFPNPIIIIAATNQESAVRMSISKK